MSFAREALVKANWMRRHCEIGYGRAAVNRAHPKRYRAFQSTPRPARQRLECACFNTVFLMLCPYFKRAECMKNLLFSLDLIAAGGVERNSRSFTYFSWAGPVDVNRAAELPAPPGVGGSAR